jgi:hypothetical protein
VVADGSPIDTAVPGLALARTPKHQEGSVDFRIVKSEPSTVLDVFAGLSAPETPGE